jgi:hypothetical protein
MGSLLMLSLYSIVRPAREVICEVHDPHKKWTYEGAADKPKTQVSVVVDIISEPVRKIREIDQLYLMDREPGPIGVVKLQCTHAVVDHGAWVNHTTGCDGGGTSEGRVEQDVVPYGFHPKPHY